MRMNLWDDVSSHIFFQGLTTSLYMFAEATSRKVFYRESTTCHDSSQEFVSESRVLKENKTIVNLPLGNMTTVQQHYIPMLTCSQDFPSSKAIYKATSPQLAVGVIPAKKSLRLAAHNPSLPKQASPLSPRSRRASPYRHLGPSHTYDPISYSGYTDSSLQLIKWHWEYRYEHWMNAHLPNESDVSFNDVEPNADSEPDLNPALFPRAGSLARPQNDPESLALIDRDWALRHWSIDKVFRTLFLHDLTQRLSYANSLRRPWECDWKMKWKIVEDAMLREHERLRQYWDNANDGICVFDEDIVMKELIGEDSMDVDGCFTV